MAEQGTHFVVSHLFENGVHFSTVIDLGCADGHYFLSQMHVLPGAVPLNIDANEIYETSLRDIKEVVGGDYRICAVADKAGEMELVQSVHPYWSSLRPEGDEYWSRVNNLVAQKVKVPVATLDSIVAETGMKPPYLLKLDLQGAEVSALRGATKVLTQTHVVIVEADIADFQDINRVMLDANFFLYDITALSRASDGSLGWFYPVYLSNALSAFRPKAFWPAEHDAEVIDNQAQRRAAIRKAISDMLAHLKASAPAK